MVALRPEMTPTLARMVAARANAYKKPIRWFSIPQLFRYERQQRGRLKEHYQLNMDIVGESEAGADADVIAAALDILRSCGFGPSDVRLHLSDRRILANVLVNDLGVHPGELNKVLAGLDKIERSPETAEQYLEAALNRDPQRARAVLNLGLTLREPDQQLLNGPHAASLREVLDRLAAMGLSEFVQLDLGIVRGLAYYTGLVFEVFDVERSFRAICGGGRYDDLISQLAGVDMPCVGFGMGDVVLGELLKERDKYHPKPKRLDVFIVAFTREDVPAVLALAQELRKKGKVVEYSLRYQNPGKQRELAWVRNAEFVLTIGPEERADNAVSIRRSQEELSHRVPRDQVIEHLKRPPNQSRAT